MTKDEIIRRMESLNRDRTWLAKACEYSYDYVKNSLAKGAPHPNKKFAAACERAFAEEERRQEVDPFAPNATVWDLVYFSGKEMRTIDRGKRAGGYQRLEDLYHDAVVDFCERLIKKHGDPDAAPDLEPLAEVADDKYPYPNGTEGKASGG